MNAASLTRPDGYCSNPGRECRTTSVAYTSTYLIEAGTSNEVPLFLKSASLDDEGLTYEFPDWITAAGRDLVGLYGEQEGRLRLQKALAVFAESYAAPDRQQRFDQACTAAAEKMTVN
jgi:hypothetical protein